MPNRRQAIQSGAAAVLLGANPWGFAALQREGCLIACHADWQTLRKRIESEPDLAAYHQSLLDEAALLLASEPVTYQKIGRRLHRVVRALLKRVVLWAYGYRTTANALYAQRATQEMLAAADFPDWNPGSFLDIAEATAAMALGSDWLADYLQPEQRQRIADAIYRHGLQPALDTGAKHNAWQRWENNWNQVCFGGLTLGALAVQAEYPQAAAQLLALAKSNIGLGLKVYAPDGVYPEGPSYWDFGTGYTALMVAGLRSATGDTWGLEKTPGFLASAQANVQLTGTTGLPFNFSDGPERSRFEPAMFWMAQELRQPGLLQFEMRQLASAAGRRLAAKAFTAPLAALWWPQKAQAMQEEPLALRWHGRGDNPVVVVRGSWTDPNSLYFAIKGGSASLNHAHMDVGSFVLELDGVRWGIDLGLQDYESLESKGVDLWSKKQTSQRWHVFRLNNHAHSTLTLDGQLHQVAGKGVFEKVQLEGAEPMALLRLDSVFAGQATSVQRQVKVQPRSVLIEDQLQGLRPGTRVLWQLPTRAQVEVQGQRAVLSQSGKQLVATLVEGAAGFAVHSLAKPLPDFNAPNPGVVMLTCEAVAAAEGVVRLAVRLGDE